MLSASITKNIPIQPGVYVFKDANKHVLYIGKAKNLQKRLQQYFAPGSLRKQEMLAQASGLDFHVVQNESEALYLEDNMIKKHQPYFNNLLKADNSYIYIKITNEKFPQVITTRKKSEDWATYIGPKHNTQNLKKFLQYLRQVLKFRGCKNTQFKQGKICSDYYFGICKGRCDKKLIPDGQDEYKKIIRTLESFFKGNTKPIKDEIKSQMQDAIKQSHFERAAILRDILAEIDGLTQQQTVVLPETETGYVIQIKPVSKWRIYVILYFYQGKLIDIIRHKEHQSEKESDEIIFDLQREFGTLYEQTNKDWLFITTMKKLRKSVKKSIFELSENLFQSYIINSSFDESNLVNDLLLSLQTRYQLKQFPYRIECIDISHLSGWRVSGGLACLLGGIKYPHGYRKYKIKTKEGDDYEALKELISRRIKNEELPNLLVIDWGKGQLNIIKKMMKESADWEKTLSHMDIISLGKGEARKKTNIWKTSTKGLVGEKIYRFDEGLHMQVQDLVYDEVDKILTSARDEAHRFANSYRKKQMSKEFSSTTKKRSAT